MKTFRIYVHPDKPRPIAVKVGFCWPAFLVGPLWFLLNRMWITFVLVVILANGAHLAMARTDFVGGLMALLYVVACLLIGFVANPLLASDLVRDGYVHRATVQASSISKATDQAVQQAETEASTDAL